MTNAKTPLEIGRVETRYGLLAYRVDGDADGPPLVLAQRFLGTMEDWDPAFIAALAAKRRVIRFDNAGVGDSSGEAPETVAKMAEAAIAFLHAMDLGEVDLLGWSLGGYVAQMTALNAPGRIRRLIVAGSGPGGVSEGPRPDPRVAVIAAKAAVDLSDLAFLFFTQSETGKAAAAQYLERVHGAPRPVVDKETGRRQRKAIEAWWKGEDVARPRLAELMIPILVANGVSDIMVPAYSSYVISQEAPDVKLVLYPDAGHAFLFQHAEAFADEIARFLDT